MTTRPYAHWSEDEYAASVRIENEQVQKLPDKLCSEDVKVTKSKKSISIGDSAVRLPQQNQVSPSPSPTSKRQRKTSSTQPQARPSQFHIACRLTIGDKTTTYPSASKALRDNKIPARLLVWVRERLREDGSVVVALDGGTEARIELLVH